MNSSKTIFKTAFRTTFAIAFGSALLASTALNAADVTFERLQHPEPQNWLMNHRTYDGQRFSPLSRILVTMVA